MYAIYKREFGYKFIGICENQEKAIKALYDELPEKYRAENERIWGNHEAAKNHWWNLVGKTLYFFSAEVKIWG